MELTSGTLGLLFVVGVVVSLASSWLLVSRLERLCERAGFSEAWLGLAAALAADAPEITSAVTALVRGQPSVGTGVVVGSNVFNLAALLGLAAVVAGRIAFHRRVVLLAGLPGSWVAFACLLAVTGVVPPVAGLALAALVLVPGIAVLGLSRTRMRRLPLPDGWAGWLIAAVHDEETELAAAIRPRPGTWRDGLTAAAALAVVVAASITMEQAATVLGRRYAVADIITGGLVLAVVTSLPNAVSAVYLARRGRGAAVLSTALNSNAINVIAGLLIPASLTGLGPRSGQGILVAAWYGGLTVLALALAYRGHGLARLPGAAVIGGYLAFVTALLITVQQSAVRPAAALVPAVVVATAGAALLGRPRRLPVRPRSSGRPHRLPAQPKSPDSPHWLPAQPKSPGRSHRLPAWLRSPGWWRRESLLPGWSIQRVWALSFALCTVVAVCDAASGPHLILIGLLIIGPCCALLTARWVLTAAAAGFALALGVVLGVPDQIFATLTQYAFLAAVAVTGLSATVGAAVLQRRRC